MSKHEQPYLHYIKQNFLPANKYQQLINIYNHLQFVQKESDLFHFYQTKQLAAQSSLDFFKESLSGFFKDLTPLKDTWYSIFASYYFKGNYLLCHDDVVEDRKYAFSYYLEDHPSGELVFYDSTATKIVKKVKVRKNLLAIFEVSNISYHEVAMSRKDGRKAVTGWLNKKGQGAKRPVKVILPYQPSIPSDIISFPLPQDISQQEYLTVPGIDYQFNIQQMNEVGPFYARKLWKLTLSQYVVLDIKGYSLYSTQFLRFQKDNYLLLNDSINTLGEDVLDVFVLEIPKGTIEGDFISIVGQSGEVQGNIPYTTNTMFIIKRGKKNYLIDLVKKAINLAHFVYKKKGKKTKIAKVQVKQESKVKPTANQKPEKSVRTIARVQLPSKIVSAKRKQIIKQKKGVRVTPRVARGRK